MRLLEIEVRHWRGLTRKLAVLSPRLNLVLGPNESGKSRIFEALQFGLFETYKGIAQRKQALQSWTSADSPSVRIAFVAGDTEYELQKQFLKGGYAQLSGGGRTIRAEEAEESLRSMLGARAASARGAGPTDKGIWPLLMVSQGDSRLPVQEHLNVDGRDRLHQRLSREIGVAAISPAGQRIMSLAEQEYLRYFTATGQDGKVLRDARTLVNAAEERFALATAAWQRQEQTAQSLANNRHELLDLEARRARARHEADSARDRADAAQVAGSLVATLQGTVNTNVHKVASVQEALNARREADETMARLMTELAAFESDIGRRVSVQSDLERSAQAAQQKFVEAGRREKDARASMDALRRQRRREELTNTSQELGSRIAALEQIERAVTEARATRARLPLIDDEGLERLKALDQSARAAHARLQGAAVSVVVHLRQDASVDGTAHRAGETIRIHVIENRRLAIGHPALGEVAEVEIRPGGGELERLRSSAAAAEQELKSALAAVGAESLSRATTLHAERVRCDQQIVELGKQARATSAKSLAQLREEQVACAAELQRLSAEDATVLDENTLQASLDTAEAALAQALSERDGAAGALAEFHNEMTALRTRIDTLRGEHARIVALHADRPSAGQLQAAVDDAVAERERSTQALAHARREFADLGGSEVQADARRFAIAADSLAVRVRDLRSAADQLQGELRTLMLGGHYESKEEAGAALDQARLELTRLERRSAAARRLWEVLSAERRRVVEKLTAPVTLRIRPYLQELFPGCVLDAGESLEVLGLQSAQLNEPFGELSGGAQEQVSLLTRIGLAEVLAGEGTLPLVLDDALINTDPERIRRIQRLLFRAAGKLQIVLFSCHDVLFDGLGAEFVCQLERRRR